MKRRVLLRVDPVFMLGMFRDMAKIERRLRVVTDIPADAVVTASAYDVERNQFVLAIESSEFAPVEQGDISPDFDLRFHLDWITEPRLGL